MDKICPERVFPLKNKKSEQHHWILHVGISVGAIFLGAMTLLGQSRESWPSMATLVHLENSQNENAMALLGQARESWPSMAPLGQVDLTKTLWHF